jgi:methylenetetrahydrofolate dehydrogenase (NADP+)/methenyltetrahydrofolate cyclohydrolase
LSALVLSGSEVAAAVRARVAERVAALAARGRPVGLATVLVGEDPASQIYVRMKHAAAAEAGMESLDLVLPASVSQADLLAEIEGLDRDPAIDGILVQLPLPSHIDERAVLHAVDPEKDADGLHPVNLGRLVLGEDGPRPATPTGILKMLDHYGITTAGADAVIVGRSFLVGRPLALMLGSRDRNATVTVAHTATRDLAAVTSRADLLVVAAGSPGLVGADHVRRGATVIDVGTNRTDSGLVGDVDFAAVAEVAGAITPVPGGVGPMTIASLLDNTVAAAERRTD